MVIQVIHCRHCQSRNVLRHGKDHGKDKAQRQRHLCHDCRRPFREQPGSRAPSEEFKARVLAAYQQRAPMRGVCRLLGIARDTLTEWLKKASQLPPPTETLARAKLDPVLELDELWSFVA